MQDWCGLGYQILQTVLKKGWASCSLSSWCSVWCRSLTWRSQQLTKDSSKWTQPKDCTPHLPTLCPINVEVSIFCLEPFLHSLILQMELCSCITALKTCWWCAVLAEIPNWLHERSLISSNASNRDSDLNISVKKRVHGRRRPSIS